MHDPAVLELLRTELEEGLPILAEAFATLGADESDETLIAATEQASAQIDCLRVAAEAGGLPGLEFVCDRLADNLAVLPASPVDERSQIAEQLLGWPETVMAYLLDPQSSDAVVALALHLTGDSWPQPLEEHEADLLAELLAAVEGDSARPDRRQEALPEDVSLIPSDDVNMDVFAAFVDDAPQHGQGLTQCLQSLTRGGDARQELDRARRIAHTLKGAAAVAGVAGIANLTHHLEDLLEYLARTGQQPGELVMSVLIDAGDCLETMIDAVRGVDAEPDNAVAVLQSVLDLANRMDRGELEQFLTEQAPVADPPVATAADDQPAEVPAAEGPAAAEAQTSLRVPTHTVDALFRYAGELSVANAQLEARVSGLLRIQQGFAEQDRVIQQRLFELEDLIDIRDVASAGYQLQGGGGDGDDFDRLEMDEYNELHGCSRALAEAIADWRELRISMHDELTALRSMVSQQGRLHRALEDSVLSTRLVPVASVEGRLQRSLRQACRATGKEAELRLEGGDLMIDTELLQGLLDPLGHLLRNAVDHGIEEPEARQAAGKPRHGVVTISVRRDGNLIEWLCEDDGRGVDLDAVRRRALERGLLETDAPDDPQALTRLVFLPGFSTRDTVTRMSGRGVGLDVVYDRVRSLKGSVDLSTAAGGGSRFRLRLPAALVTVHVLLLEVGGQTVAVPSSDLVQVPVPGAGRLEQDEQGEYWFELGDQRHQLLQLAHLMGRVAAPLEPDFVPPVVLARLDGSVRALRVDRMVGSANVVIKGFGVNLPRLRGVLGAAILGNGAVAPVLDLSALQRSVAMDGMDLGDPVVEGDMPSLGEILVVDDSLSVRRSLSQFLEDSGYSVRQARDGIEAVRAVEAQVPDLVLADLEMPRMNGLELTAHLRSRDDTRALPVVMLTSRAMQKHRSQAAAAGVSEYLTKPFQETELLDVIERLMPAMAQKSAATA